MTLATQEKTGENAKTVGGSEICCNAGVLAYYLLLAFTSGEIDALRNVDSLMIAFSGPSE